MRIWFVTVLIAASACGGSRSASFDKASSPEGDDNADPGSSSIACRTADDCVLAAASCCACPTFAIGVFDRASDACGEVDCEPAMCPMNVQAICEDGSC